VRAVLTGLEPGTFTPQCWASVDQHPDHHGLLCFALNVAGESKIPRDEYPQICFLDTMVTLCKMRYDMMGSRLKGENILKCIGYYQIDPQDRLKINLTRAPGSFIALPFNDVPADGCLKNTFQQDAGYMAVSLGMSLKLRALCAPEQLQAMVPEDAAWALPGVTAEEIPEEIESSGGTTLSLPSPAPKTNGAGPSSGLSASSPNAIDAANVNGLAVCGLSPLEI
jgi:hypothetical protein